MLSSNRVRRQPQLERVTENCRPELARGPAAVYLGGLEQASACLVPAGGRPPGSRAERPGTPDSSQLGEPMPSRHDRSQPAGPASPAAAAAPSRLSRRAFIAGAAAAGALAWTPVFRAGPASARPPARRRPASRHRSPLYQQAYQNWAGMIVIDASGPAPRLRPTTWSRWPTGREASGYRLRAKGMSHNWSPILLPAGSTGAGYVLVDTTQHLTSVSVAAGITRHRHRGGRASPWTP